MCYFKKVISVSILALCLLISSHLDSMDGIPQIRPSGVEGEKRRWWRHSNVFLVSNIVTLSLLAWGLLKYKSRKKQILGHYSIINKYLPVDD